MTPTLERPALLTDLYQLTMLGGQFALGREGQRAVFEYFFRKLPPETGFAVFAGLEDLLEALEVLRFHPEELEYLRSLNLFRPDFLEYLKGFRFEGEVWAAPEGSVVFPQEPLVRVVAPITQGQLVETLLLNLLNYQTLIATKAARICQVAAPDPVLEFGLRRAQGPDGGLAGSRASFIGGCAATSNVAAGRRWGIPVRGTHAHSWVMSFESELESFRAYAQVYPDAPLFLVDTYDTLESGVPNAVTVFRELRAAGWGGRAAIRLDSGDLARLSKDAHRLLEEAGFRDPLIVASNDLDEELVADLKRQGARINCWGIGTKLITGGSTPALGGVYKLAAIADPVSGSLIPRMKISGNPEKTTDPGVKMPHRLRSETGTLLGDVLFLDEEPSPPPGQALSSQDRGLSTEQRRFPASAVSRPLLELRMKGGRRLAPAESLGQLRQRAASEVASLPEELRRLRLPEYYWVGLSPALAELKRREFARLRNGQGPSDQ